jgi:hypothetical protein
MSDPSGSPPGLKMIIDFREWNYRGRKYCLNYNSTIKWTDFNEMFVSQDMSNRKTNQLSQRFRENVAMSIIDFKQNLYLKSIDMLWKYSKFRIRKS